jgi:hypothetical protein
MSPAEISGEEFKIENRRVTHIPTGAWFEFNAKTAAIEREDAEGAQYEMIRLWAMRLWLQHMLENMKKAP